MYSISKSFFWDQFMCASGYRTPSSTSRTHTCKSDTLNNHGSFDSAITLGCTAAPESGSLDHVTPLCCQRDATHPSQASPLASPLTFTHLTFRPLSLPPPQVTSVAPQTPRGSPNHQADATDTTSTAVNLTCLSGPSLRMACPSSFMLK